MPKCFIIMPITTRPELLSVYKEDAEHFAHVLDHLLIPSVMAAGFAPIPPTTQGSDVIHASIISNLTAADMVLCDMSALNPNVFFELGIRTALNKPTCLIKDDVTKHVPFDTSIINYYTYGAELLPWKLENEKEKLTAHIKSTVSSEQPGNALWKYFGLSHAAHLPPAKPGEDSKLDYLTVKVDQLTKVVESQQQQRQAVVSRSEIPIQMKKAPSMVKTMMETISLAELAEETGIATSALLRMANDDHKTMTLAQWMKISEAWIKYAPKPKSKP